MAKRNKLMKFAEMRSFQNVFQNFDPKVPILITANDKEIDLKGQWCKLHFDNDHPLVLELACGRGEYSLGLARIYPDKNFLGVDIKGARIWKGANIALNEEIKNVAFLRTRIEILNKFIDEKEVDEIWITFPDPFVAKENRRLTSPRFLDMYKTLLKDDGVVHLKTDAISLYEYSLEVLGKREDIKIEVSDPDIYSHEVSDELVIKTYYERMHLDKGKKITYLRFKYL